MKVLVVFALLVAAAIAEESSSSSSSGGIPSIPSNLPNIPSGLNPQQIAQECANNPNNCINKVPGGSFVPAGVIPSVPEGVVPSQVSGVISQIPNFPGAGSSSESTTAAPASSR